ncbi:amidase [Halohasta salina]|uniref:amidase n=1 Tax=Halohasta salina TaxID=2961621 RepID=UPI0020A5B18D|nr:amidase [Halohasta salina]
MDRSQLGELTIEQFHARLRTDELTVDAVVRAYLDRIQALDRSGPALNAVVTTNDEAMGRARRLDAALADEGFVGPLHGVPVLVKDQAMTAGLRTTFGSAAFADYVPDTSATIVDRLESAGAVILGKTNLPDFAAGFVGYSSAGGQTRNPYDRSRDSGGSSAGTGAGIAANLGLVGIGEDTGGSIRVPASFCNLFGLRVTTGLISRAGMSPLVAEQDTPGPMCRTVDDLARVLDVIVGFDPADEATAVHSEWTADGSFVDAVDGASLDGARIGVLREAFGDSDETRVTAVNETVESALVEIEAAGATLVDPVEIDGLEQFIDDTSLYGLVAKRDLNAFFNELSDPPVDAFEDIYEQGAYHEALEHVQTIADAPADPTGDREYWWRLARQAAFRRRIEYTLVDHDLDALAFPDVQVVPPVADDYHTGEITRADVPTNTFIASQSGCPAISMPAGFTDEGLPVGIELLGAPLADRRLVELAAAYESATEPRRSPALE